MTTELNQRLMDAITVTQNTDKISQDDKQEVINMLLDAMNNNDLVDIQPNNLHIGQRINLVLAQSQNNLKQ